MPQGAARTFVYHLVPPDLRGSVLHPLNRLRAVYPEVAARQLAKYAGREQLLARRVPPLDCLWNDVLMFSPVHPAALKAALETAGHRRAPRRWFAIDAARFTPEDTAIYLPGNSPAEARFVPFAPGCLAQYADVSEAQRRFYRRAAPGQPVFLFGGTPHVLYKGSVDIARASVIDA